MNPERHRVGIKKAEKILKIERQQTDPEWDRYLEINFPERFEKAEIKRKRRENILKKTRKPCSCDNCCTPRNNKWNDHPETLQEKKEKDSFKDQCKECEDCKCKSK